MAKVQSYYSRTRPNGLDLSKKKSRTKQQYLNDANINNLMAKYIKTGIAPEAGTRQPIYGDFSNGNDYRNVVENINHANHVFSLLDSETRKGFGNDPAQMLDFMSKPENAEKCRNLGLLPQLETKSEVVAAEPISENVKTPEKAAEPAE